VIRRGPTRLSAATVTLREVSPEDVEDLYLWRQQQRVQALFQTPGPSSFDQHRDFVARYFAPGNDDAWFIVECDGTKAGALAFYRNADGEWEAGRIVLAEAWKGLAAVHLSQKAIALLKEFGRQTGHREMRAAVLVGNRTMLSIDRSMGFAVVGIIRKGDAEFFALRAALFPGGEQGTEPASDGAGEMPAPPEVDPLRLRLIGRENAADLFAWRMDETSRPMFRHTEAVPYAAHEEMLDRYLAGSEREYWYVIDLAGSAVGALAIYGFSADGREAEWGRFVIAPPYRGAGLGGRAVAQLLHQARTLGLARLHCDVLASNRSALRIYKRLGFTAGGEASFGGRPFVRMLVELGTAS